MATESLNTQVSISLVSTLQKQANLASQTEKTTCTFSESWGNGITIDNATRIWSERYLLTNNATQLCNLANLGADGLGVTVSLAGVKALLIKQASVTANQNITVGVSGVNAWDTPWAGTQQGVNIGPDGTFVTINPSALGFPVTATNAILRIYNPNNANINTDIFVVGI
jgi:hypothetical protein